MNAVFSIKKKGRRFKIPVIKETGYYNLVEAPERWMDCLLEDLCRLTDGYFLDGGINIGQTLLKLETIDPKRPYVGFEPNPVCASYCMQLVNINKMDHCTIYPVGLFDKDAVLTLIMDKEYGSGASLLENFRKNKKRYHIKVNVPVFRGDEVLESHGHQNTGIIKLDIEGAELEAVKGLYNTIKQTQPYIIAEILPVYIMEEETGRYRKKREEELLSILFELGYKMYRINEQEIKLVPLTSIEVHQSMQHTNYLFVHTSKEHTITEMKHFSR